MPRGGYKGGHRSRKFSGMETTTIRVPQALSEQLIDIALKLAKNEPIEAPQKLNLSNVKVYQLHKRQVVRVDDLVRCGYHLDFGDRC